MIRPFDGKIPKIADSAYISEFSYIVGDVEIGRDSSVWPGAVIRADFCTIKIGKNVHVEDNVVIHGPVDIEIGDNVIIGHSAVFHGKKIGNNVLVGMNATVLNDVEIDNRCVIAGGAVVLEGMKIPDESFVAGVPAKIKSKISANQEAWINSDVITSSYGELSKKYKRLGL